MSPDTENLMTSSREQMIRSKVIEALEWAHPDVDVLDPNVGAERFVEGLGMDSLDLSAFILVLEEVLEIDLEDELFETYLNADSLIAELDRRLPPTWGATS